jgi:pimeloyl-ACP methyl ester carboxylesterase
VSKTTSAPNLDYNLFGPPTGPKVVLVNGLGGVQAAWLHQVRGLADYFRVLTYDHRGVGGSDVVDEPTSMATYADDLLRLFRELEWGEPVRALGLSFGGRVLQSIAIDHPEAIERLILGGTSCGGARHVQGDADANAAMRTLGAATEQDWLDKIAPALFGSKYRTQHPDRIKNLARWRGRHPPDMRGIARQWEAYESFETCDRLAEIRCPTLIIHGKDDHISPVRNAEILHEGIPGSQLVLWDDLGHSPNVEDPERFNLVVRDFFLRGE